jgi:hypothetical protein
MFQEKLCRFEIDFEFRLRSCEVHPSSPRLAHSEISINISIKFFVKLPTKGKLSRVELLSGGKRELRILSN